MDAILLRTLTAKSTFGFGKYYDFPVKYCLDNKFHPYLRWVYYNCSMISFIPEILDTILIPIECRISKPGKYPEKGDALNDLILMRMLGYTKWKIKQHKKKVNKSKNIGREIKERKKFSKSNLQRLNHGH